MKTIIYTLVVLTAICSVPVRAVNILGGIGLGGAGSITDIRISTTDTAHFNLMVGGATHLRREIFFDHTSLSSSVYQRSSEIFDFTLFQQFHDEHGNFIGDVAATAKEQGENSSVVAALARNVEARAATQSSWIAAAWGRGEVTLSLDVNSVVDMSDLWGYESLELGASMYLNSALLPDVAEISKEFSDMQGEVYENSITTLNLTFMLDLDSATRMRLHFDTFAHLSTVPEPGTLSLFSLGLLALGFVRRSGLSG